MSAEIVRNAPVREEYEIALKALKPILYNLPAVIIAIDGRPGSGKTTLGRFLAWRFNVTLLETDLFLNRGEGKFVFKNEQIKEIIKHRMNSEHPIIVEGVVVLRILEELDYKHAFHIHLICDESEGSAITEREWELYDGKFNPKSNSDLNLELPPLLQDALSTC